MASSTSVLKGVKPFESPPQDVSEILAIESSLILPVFTAATAWAMGCALRERLLEFPAPAVISITHANTSQILFHACTHSGTAPDNDVWVARKRKTVLRWGVSTWYMGRKFDGNEKVFEQTYGLGEAAGEYAIHGGGLPIKVKGVEGVVGVVIVSGLKQWEDHAVVVEILQRFCEQKD